MCVPAFCSTYIRFNSLSADYFELFLRVTFYSTDSRNSSSSCINSIIVHSSQSKNNFRTWSLAKPLHSLAYCRVKQPCEQHKQCGRCPYDSVQLCRARTNTFCCTLFFLYCTISLPIIGSLYGIIPIIVSLYGMITNNSAVCWTY